MKIPDEVAKKKAEEIYVYLCEWVTDEFQGKDLRKSGPFLTPAFVHNRILEILRGDNTEREGN